MWGKYYLCNEVITTTMTTVRFFTRTITKDKNALVPIYVRVRAGRKTDVCCKIDISVRPESWSNETQKARQRAEVFTYREDGNAKKGVDEFNQRIDGLRGRIDLAITETPQSDINAAWLIEVIDKYWHPEKYAINLHNFITDFIKKSETKPNSKTGRPVSYKMRREYEATFAHLKEYCTNPDYWKESDRFIDFKDIDLNFYSSFTSYLQGKQLAVNTIGKKIQTLKIFLNAAKEEGLNHYEGFKSKKFVAISEDADTIALNEAELNAITGLDLSDNPRLDKVRDMFLLGCWTGCRFSDLDQIKPENIKDGLLHIRQQKTGTKVVLPLHPVVTAIINKYGDNLPEPISNQKMNDYLKEVAEAAKINEMVYKQITKGGVRLTKPYKKFKLVTTHCARRSFATNLYHQGMPTLSIMAVTGHKTEEAFLRYIKITPEEHARKLQTAWDNRHLKVV